MLRSLLAIALMAAPLAAGPVLKIDRTQVNIRADATVQSARVAVLQQGVEIEALGRKDEWFRIRLPEGGEGWIHSGLVQEIVVVTGDAVRLREAGSTNAPMIATASKGDELGKVGERGNWYEVALPGGDRGWIWKELVQPKAFLLPAPTPVEESVVEPAPLVEESVVESAPPVVRSNPYADGLVRAAAGEYEEALALFNEVLADNPTHADALLRAAKAHEQLGDLDHALDRLYQAVAVSEGRIDIYVTLAEVYRQAGVPDSAAKYLALFRGEKWERPEVTAPPESEPEGDMPVEAWWIYALGCLVAVIVLGGVVIALRMRVGDEVSKEPVAKPAKGKFARQMRQSKAAPAVGGGEEAELERQIQQKREDLQQSSAAFLGPNALGEGEDAHMEQVLGQVAALRKALEAQDERADIYTDIVRLQNAKIDAMERELAMLRRRSKR